MKRCAWSGRPPAARSSSSPARAGIRASSGSWPHASPSASIARRWSSRSTARSAAAPGGASAASICTTRSSECRALLERSADIARPSASRCGGSVSGALAAAFDDGVCADRAVRPTRAAARDRRRGRAGERSRRRLARALAALEPHGPGNPEPTLLARGVASSAHARSAIRRRPHLRCGSRQDGRIGSRDRRSARASGRSSPATAARRRLHPAFVALAGRGAARDRGSDLRQCDGAAEPLNQPKTTANCDIP